MRRRDFVTFLGGAAVAWPLVVNARFTYRVGTLTVSSFERASHSIKAFEESMVELGYVSGLNVTYEHRFANGQLQRPADLAKDLAALNVDIIVAGSNGSISAAKQVTSTIPIVTTYSIDPIGTRFIPSFPRPGGNITGMTGERRAVPRAGR